MNHIENFDQILLNSFNTNIKSNIPVLDLNDLVSKDFPNGLQYITTSSIIYNKTNKDSVSQVELFAKNHPKLREIDNFVNYNIFLYDLEYSSYNYCIFKDTVENKFHIVFGKVTSCMELGVKHSILCKGFPIYLAGEIKKEKLDEDNDKFIFNFFSGNFEVENIRKIAFDKLSKICNKNNNIIDKYNLSFNKYNKTDSDKIKNEYENLLAIFYYDIIKPFAIEIFNNISGYFEEINIQCDIVARDLYSIRNNTDYYTYLHPCYDKKQEPGYNVDVIDLINNKGRSEEINGMCIYPEEKNCDQNTEDNRIDILEELFIQLIYQGSLIHPGNYVYWVKNNTNIKINIIKAINDAKLYNYFDSSRNIYNEKNFSNVEIANSNIKILNMIINKYLSRWFYRYITKNYNFLENLLKIPRIIDKNKLKKYVDINDENLKKELLIIKILLYAYMRLFYAKDINECIFYELDEEIEQKYYLKVNNNNIYFTFRSKYVNYLQFDKICYAKVNDSYIYVENNNENTINNVIDEYFEDNIVSRSIEDIIQHDIDNLIKEISSPICYITKYFKYKEKYIKYKNCK